MCFWNDPPQPGRSRPARLCLGIQASVLRRALASLSLEVPVVELPLLQLRRPVCRAASQGRLCCLVGSFVLPDLGVTCHSPLLSGL